VRPARAVALGLVSAATLVTLVVITLAAVPTGRAVSHVRPAGTIAAADGYPAPCLDVTISPSDSSYARADLDRASSCGRFWWTGVAIFRRVPGGWVTAFRAANYECPVNALPPTVQSDLAVCP
jgi:hypothetical protein